MHWRRACAALPFRRLGYCIDAAGSRLPFVRHGLSYVFAGLPVHIGMAKGGNPGVSFGVEGRID